MARQQGTVAQNTFIQGLITEATALRFPENAATDTLNCVFDETGRVTRRPGLGFEDDYEFRIRTKATGDVYTEYFWQSVGGRGDTSFVVQQQGSDLFFYDVSSSNSVSSNHIGTIDLDSFVPSGSALSAGQSICQYASGQGKLLVVSQAIDPLLIEFDPTSASFIATAIEITARDFVGLDDGLDEGERPTASVAGLISANPEHYYNLLNQSWFIAQALNEWDSSRTDLPSNRDYVALTRGSQTDPFDIDIFNANTPGSRPAPKGHFILNVFAPDHTQAMADEGFTASISADEVQVAQSNFPASGRFGDLFHGFAGNFGPLWDGDTTDDDVSDVISKMDATTGYAGARATLPINITKAIVYGTNNDGYVDDNIANPTVTLTLYAKQGSTPPANSTDGTVLGTVNFTDQSDESGGRTITSSDTTTEWNYVWVKLDHDGAATLIYLVELQIFTNSANEGIFSTTERPQCIEFFAGRAWYAGVDFSKLSSNIYFSQIIQKNDQFGKCYQANDPASEDFTDLLPDDGGVIVIPEIAQVKRLFAYQSALLIFATNGVWMITGGSQGGFLATDFVVKKLSSEGTNSPLSFLSYKGVPAWWGDNGIFTIQFDPNYQSFAVTSLSDEKIKAFFASVPGLNRSFVKGVFDQNNSVGYWLFNSDTTLAESDYYRYDSVLGVNGLSGAFYPWGTTIKPERDGPEIRGAVFIANPRGLFAPVIKIVTTVDSDPFEDLSYAEINALTYKDWSQYAEDEDNPDFEQDYTSYFITGYRLDGQGLRFFQANYIIVFTEDDGSDMSCFVQGIYDFTTSGSSGKWSMPQQCFNPNLVHRSVNYRRLKIRGRGRSLQLMFTSESGKPFTIIGWSIWETANAAV